jgi:hypothetical protein
VPPLTVVNGLELVQEIYTARAVQWRRCWGMEGGRRMLLLMMCFSVAAPGRAAGDVGMHRSSLAQHKNTTEALVDT